MFSREDTHAAATAGPSSEAPGEDAVVDAARLNLARAADCLVFVRNAPDVRRAAQSQSLDRAEKQSFGVFGAARALARRVRDFGEGKAPSRRGRGVGDTFEGSLRRAYTPGRTPRRPGSASATPARE